MAKKKNIPVNKDVCEELSDLLVQVIAGLSKKEIFWPIEKMRYLGVIINHNVVIAEIERLSRDMETFILDKTPRNLGRIEKNLIALKNNLWAL